MKINFVITKNILLFIPIIFVASGCVLNQSSKTANNINTSNIQIKNFYERANQQSLSEKICIEHNGKDLYPSQFTTKQMIDQGIGYVESEDNEYVCVSYGTGDIVVTQHFCCWDSNEYR